MGAEGASLFRQEVLRHRADRLQGTVSLLTPTSWQAIGFLLIMGLAATIVFLATASYARVETAPGSITLDKGVASVVSSRAGTVAALIAKDGQHVRAGDLLVRIRSEEDMVNGDTAPARIRHALAEQDTNLASQGGSTLAAAAADQRRLQEQILGLSGEVTSLTAQARDQQGLLDLATADYRSVEKLAANGYISRRDLEARQSVVLSRRQQLAQLEQLRTSKVAAIAEARRSILQVAAAAQAQLARAQSDRAGLAQQLAQADLARGYVITSPVEGNVTAVTARLGQTVATQQQLMMVVPAGAELQTELYVPTAAGGFLRPGQEVRLAVDAFPYQRFGTVPARVVDISATTVARQGPNGPVPVYLVTAKLLRPWIQAFGRRQALAPGMTLNARIITEHRTLIEWLFEPVFAVRNR